jgi:tRNA U38,U39,U40 pseudouridine synthase TruA
MIRIMVGSLVETCVKQDSGAVERMLKARDRRAAGRTAPGQGLSLVEIFYGDLPSLDEIKRRKGLTFTAY